MIIIKKKKQNSLSKTHFVNYLSKRKHCGSTRGYKEKKKKKKRNKREFWHLAFY